MAVPELDKPAGQWCVHCVKAQGCAIHDERPQSCRDFDCLWRLDPALADDLRPDRTKVVLVMNGDGTSIVARCDPADPLAWRREPIYSTLKRWAAIGVRGGGQVVAAAGRHTWLITPTAAQPDLDLGDIDLDSPLVIKLERGQIVEVKMLPPRNRSDAVRPVGRSLTVPGSSR
jgi:hypothetical protein